MTNVLIISPTPSHPTIAGNRARILTLVESLRGMGIGVGFLYLGREGLDPNSLALMDCYFPEFSYIEPIREPRIPADQVATSIYGIDDWTTPDLIMGVRALTSGKRFDAVIVNYVMYSRLFDLFGDDVVKILDTHDRMGGRHEVLDAAGIARNFFWTSAEEEANAVRRADIVLAIQDEERAYFESLGARRVLTIGHKPAARGHFLMPPPRAQRVFGAIGSDNAVNKRYFADLIAAWPTSAMRLCIAGSVCNALVSPGPNVELLGNVLDLDHFYGSVDVIVNPIAMGTGLKIKSLEALSYGKPIVSTREGMRGLDAVAEAHLLRDAAEVVAFSVRLAAEDTLLAQTLSASQDVFGKYVREYDTNFAGFLAQAKLDQAPRNVATEARPAAQMAASGKPALSSDAPGGVWARGMKRTASTQVAAVPVHTRTATQSAPSWQVTLNEPIKLNEQLHGHVDVTVLNVSVGEEVVRHVRTRFCRAPDGCFLEFRRAKDWPEIFADWPGTTTEDALRVSSAKALAALPGARDRALVQGLAAILPDIIAAVVLNQDSAVDWVGEARRLSTGLRAPIAASGSAAPVSTTLPVAAPKRAATPLLSPAAPTSPTVGKLATTRAAESAGATLAGSKKPSAESRPAGPAMIFSAANPPPEGLLEAGWYPPEEWGIWSRIAASCLRIPYGPNIQMARLTVRVPVGKKVTRRKVVAYVNEILAGEWSVETNRFIDLLLTLPPVEAPTTARVVLNVGGVFTPRELEGTGSKRPLGLMLRGLQMIGSKLPDRH